MDKVEVDASGCWIFTGSVNHAGYGLISRGEPTPHLTLRVHRVVYEHHKGPIAEGLALDHLCAVKRCCNPDHLEPVTTSENAKRQWRDGRGYPGTYNKVKTHCPQGHPYDEANTRFYRGKRHCRKCEAAAQRRRYAMRKVGA